jgi:hypothetical protein
MERITRENLEARVSNLNRRMDSRGSAVRYQIESRNGRIGLDRFTRDEAAAAYAPDSVPGRGIGWVCLSTVTVGTKREIAEFLHAMMVALDDAEIYARKEETA